jgi:GDP-L-fucose synthase
MKQDSRIFVAGHKGLVGSALVRKLKELGYTNILTVDRTKIDLRSQFGVNDWFYYNKPEYVFLAAAKVGGIKANNDFKADFITENLQIQTNVIYASHNNKVKKLMFLGSSCIYPKMCPQPIKEEYLLSGYLEDTNDSYAIAKIAGLKMCQSYKKQYNDDFISVMPTNLYGIGDNYHPDKSHVIPGLIRRFHQAKIDGLKDVVCWGDGTARREFLFADDLADACVFLMNKKETFDSINIGIGEDMTIKELTEVIKNVVYPDANIVFNGDVSMNGTPQKLLDVSKLDGFGWKAKVDFVKGIELSYNDFLNKA